MKRRTISRHFRKHMDIYERQVFTARPRTRAITCWLRPRLHGGDGQVASLILDLELWALVPGDGAGEATKEMLRGKIKAEAPARTSSRIGVLRVALAVAAVRCSSRPTSRHGLVSR